MVETAAVREPVKPLDSPVLVIAGASIGTLFEWYDFFLYGSLAAQIAKQFFAGVDERAGFTLALGAFGAGFIARPFGALVFGRIGDLVGRKNTFLVTMTIMGLSTFFVGLLPGFATLGVAAPIILVALRLLQGLAIGGEYGGAAIYVAEHAPANRRAFYTSFINAMATGGLVTSLLVIIAFRLLLSADDFQAWGWRMPFLVSAGLLAVSLWIRLKLGESPVFKQMQEENTVSKAPLSETFGQWKNLKLVLSTLFGSIAASTVIWYSAQFYTLFFLQRLLKVDELTTNIMMATALTIAVPSFLFFGWLSDRIGRKGIILAGCALGAVCMFPAFHGLTEAANPALARAQRTAPVVVYADPAVCSVQFDPVGSNHFNSSDCDIAKSFLSRAGVSYASAPLPAGGRAEIRAGGAILRTPDPRGLSAPQREKLVAAFKTEAQKALSAAGYPEKADPAQVDAPRVIAIVAFMVVLAAMTYAPGAAYLVELFPARIRYTALSFPYHLGSGWIGGLLPAAAFAIVTTRGDIYSGLWYPVAFSTVGTLIFLVSLPETLGRSIDG